MSDIASNNFLSFFEQHWLLTTIFLVTFLILIMIEFIKIRKGHKAVSPTQATQMINRQNAGIVDIRPSEQFNKGHIVDAISLPFPDIDKKIKRIEKYKNQPIIIVCHSGKESNQAAQLLAQKGFNQVHILGGGISSWKQAELPLITESK